MFLCVFEPLQTRVACWSELLLVMKLGFIILNLSLNKTTCSVIKRVQHDQRSLRCPSRPGNPWAPWRQSFGNQKGFGLYITRINRCFIKGEYYASILKQLKEKDRENWQKESCCCMTRLELIKVVLRIWARVINTSFQKIKKNCVIRNFPLTMRLRKRFHHNFWIKRKDFFTTI